MDQHPGFEVEAGDTEGHATELAPAVAMLIGHANLQGVPTLSMDDDYPSEMIWVAAGWFATALMVWRER